MPRGSGAIVLHRAIEANLRDYQVVPYRPGLTVFPPALRLFVPSPPARLIHTTPDYAVFFKRRDLPLVSTFHNIVIDEFMKSYSSALQRLHYRTDLRFFLRRAIQVSDRLTAVSQFTADLARRELGCDRDIEVIPNGVDVDRFRPAISRQNDNRLRVLFCGNPTLRKGAQWLPEIARRVGDSAEIVCASGLRGGWIKRLDAAGVKNLGQVPYASMPELYRSVDALLLPTVREGDSLVVLEAMSSGLPVVASNCSSLPERVAHGDGGYLPEIGDVEGFADSLLRLREPGLRKRMGDFNRARAEAEFSLPRMVSRYEALFDEL